MCVCVAGGGGRGRAKQELYLCNTEFREQYRNVCQMMIASYKFRVHHSTIVAIV